MNYIKLFKDAASEMLGFRAEILYLVIYLVILGIAFWVGYPRVGVVIVLVLCIWDVVGAYRAGRKMALTGNWQ